ncbi:hypothetical protein BJ973_009305 [Actinoplanes tereljensis]|uniref:DUF5666 domain-containing protein n=1 Tax=Paractinoplanes tereljensis TaxID=571912 RepID=A0A919NGH8_9ACTN|nr:hypothetical protein [Actinoplanes tereljensis]GIF17730.1 hypothetical protein Ate02nite_04600 [Actinoplanes tereljensis]
MRRTFVVLSLTGALALAACGAPAAVASDVADEAVALQQVGFETGLADTPSAEASAGDAPRKTIRKYLRRNTLHGEVVIQTRKNGPKTVVVQRGSVTAVSADSVSVKSTDGFALTWKFGDKLRVVQDRKTTELSALKTGAEIGLAGTRDGDVTSARLIAIT